MFTLSHHLRNSWKRCTVNFSTTMNWVERLGVDDCGHLLILQESLTLKVAATLVKLAMLPPMIRILPEGRNMHK